MKYAKEQTKTEWEQGWRIVGVGVGAGGGDPIQANRLEGYVGLRLVCRGLLSVESKDQFMGKMVD